MTERKDLGVVRRSVKESNEISPGKEGDLAAEESLFLLGRIPLGVITQSRVVEGGEAATHFCTVLYRGHARDVAHCLRLTM